MTSLPPGIVVVPTGHQPRYYAFLTSLWALEKTLPAGSVVKLTAGPDVTHNINAGIERGLKDCPGAAWAWVIGDDHTFAPDIIERLWASHVPVVVPFVLKRFPPYSSVLFHRPAGGAMVSIAPEKQQTGLMRVAIAGGAGMLIRRDVLDVINRPWFENRGTERQGEDIAFCEKLLNLNIPLHVNFDVQMGHLTPVEIWPTRHPEQGWVVAMKHPAGETLL